MSAQFMDWNWRSPTSRDHRRAALASARESRSCDEEKQETSNEGGPDLRRPDLS
jgi:hypothetical protein